LKLGDPILPVNPDTEYAKQLHKKLLDFFRALNTKVNGLATGAITHSADNGSPTIPTSGTWKKGDFVVNTAPAELGIATAKYVVMGWVRMTDGSANVANVDWCQSRTLTGN
jgi:hypothetical protein